MDEMDLGKILAKLEEISEQNVKRLDDHEHRLRFIERILGYGSGVIGTVLFLVNYLK